MDQLDVLPGPFMMLPFKVAFISHRFLTNWIYCSVYYILYVIYYAMYFFENEKKKKELFLLLICSENVHNTRSESSLNQDQIT